MEQINYTLQIQIQAFVNGELQANRRAGLLAQAAEDSTIADELAFSQSLANALKNRELAAASAILSGIIAEEGFPPPPAPTNDTWWTAGKGWLLGSILIVMMGAGTFYGLTQYQTGRAARAYNQQLVQNTLLPLENVLLLAPANSVASDLLKRGMDAYDAAQYKTAAQALSTYCEQMPDPAARVYLGIAYLMDGHAKLAIGPLLEVSQAAELPVREAASWYLSLAYLAENEVALAKKTIMQLPPDGLFGPAALDLLAKLQKK